MRFECDAAVQLPDSMTESRCDAHPSNECTVPRACALPYPCAALPSSADHMSTVPCVLMSANSTVLAMSMAMRNE